MRRRDSDLEGQLAELRERNQALRRFVADAAHELVEPLVTLETSAVALGADLVKYGAPDLVVRADSMGKVAARGRLLVDTLLQDAESSERPPELQPIELADVVADALTLLERTIQAVSAEVVVGPMPTITSHAQLLSIVIRNLVANGVKYASPQAKSVQITADRIDTGWRLSVISRGRRIPQADVERVFRRFERGDEKARGRGSGLGLAICARIVERLGGVLGVVPEPGVGNRFFLLLPDARSDTAPG